MSHLLDEQYLEWLYSQVASVKTRTRSRTYWNILRQLYCKEFAWFVPNDDNRAEDGRYLRYEFVEELGLDMEEDWFHLPCSMLEMMIGLSRRLSFEAEGEPRWWFWHLMGNLGLHELNDAVEYSEEEVDEVLDRVIWRTYLPDGRGGLFPLKHAEQDQTRVELWYQLSAYLLERS